MSSITSTTYKCIMEAKELAFQTKFIELSPKGKLINKAILGNSQPPDKRTWIYKNKLKDNRLNIFKDAGFDWAGHQKYVENCVHHNLYDSRGKKQKCQYYFTIKEAIKNAKFYGASAIVMTEIGFSLRYGTDIKTTDNIGHGRGMGVWISKYIDINQIIKNDPGSGITDRMKEGLVKNSFDNCEARKSRIYKHGYQTEFNRGGRFLNKKNPLWNTKTKKSLSVCSSNSTITIVSKKKKKLEPQSKKTNSPKKKNSCSCSYENIL